jgi:hypothetical protein
MPGCYDCPVKAFVVLVSREDAKKRKEREGFFKQLSHNLGALRVSSCLRGNYWCTWPVPGCNEYLIKTLVALVSREDARIPFVA